MKAAGCGFYNTEPPGLPQAARRPRQRRGQPDGLPPRLLGERPRHHGALPLRVADRPPGRRQPAVPGGTASFVEIDLHPYRRHPDGSIATGPDGQPEPNVTNHEMGYIFEELIRRFSEQSNETAGEHFTPREVIRFMVNLLFAEDDAGPAPARHRAHHVRPRLRHRRHALGGGGLPRPAQPPGAAPGLRPGAERRVLRHLQGGHAGQGPGGRQHQVRQLLQRRRAARPQGRLPHQQPALRGGLVQGREGGARRARDARATPGASAPGCRARTTARCSSCCTC